jgi:hypothetical protein
LRAACTELAADQRSIPIMSKSDHGGSTCMASDADMFDDGSLFLAFFLVLNRAKHSAISKLEMRLHGVHRRAICQMTATDKTLDLEERRHPGWQFAPHRNF